MRSARRTRLWVEQLEDRRCPSLTVSLVSGSLYVSGVPTGTLTIQETGTNVFRVMDGTVFLGAYTASNLNVRLTSRPADVNILLNATGLGGNLSLDLGTGDTVGGPSSIHVGGGRIGGSLTGLRGGGNETYDLGFDATGGTSPLTVGGSVSVTAVTSRGSGGSQPRDTLFLNTGSSIGLDLTTTFVDSVFLAPGTSVGRNVSVNNSLEHTMPDTFLEGNIGQDVTITGPATGISVDLGSLGAAVIGRNLSINAPAGNSSVTLAAGSLVGGTAGITTGGGNDSIDLGGQVNGNATVSTGDGTDTVSLDAGAAVFGSLRINGGNGDNTLTVDGSVGGDLVFNLGNGNNTATVSQAPGGVLRWTSGNGNDSLTLTDTNSPAGTTWTVNVVFGSGDDTFALTGTTSQFLTGSVDGGGHILGNVFSPGANWTLQSTFMLSNFP
jgi:hypothetical protein